ncbi:MAG: UDP-N-acetylglucosamine 1-carboxyvinyltransferase [Clostridia bacterium]
MEHLYVTGHKKLSGVIDIQGAKNSVLPILAATILNPNISIIHNCPDLTDVTSAIEILQYIGCTVTREKNTIIVNAKNITKSSIPDNLMRQMRSSVMFLGPILARTGTADLTFPGGCELGPRPIDLHISALEKIGCKFLQNGVKIKGKVENLQGNDVHLSFPSVGATENALMTACYAKGFTKIINAAREPEIIDLANYLQKLGVKISGAGQSTIEVCGGIIPSQIEHTVMADRIVAATYLSAVAMTGGEIEIRKVNPEHFFAVTEVLKQANCDVEYFENRVKLSAKNKKLQAIKPIKTLPYPGFPTDAQAIIMSAMTVSDGTSVFVENIFENRYRHVNELLAMGADIKIFGKTCLVTGKEELSATKVVATDLRGGAALVLAGLVAEGETEICEISHILRGYEKIDEVLGSLGAKIYKK